MEIEIIEYYPFKHDEHKRKYEGTLHVYLCDEDMDIRGVLVRKTKHKYVFRLPFKTTIDPKTGNAVQYPFFQYSNKKKQAEFNALLIKEATRYLNERVFKR